MTPKLSSKSASIAVQRTSFSPLSFAFLLLALLAVCSSARAQVAPAYSGHTNHLAAGGYFSNFSTDYAPNRSNGVGFFFDWDLWRRLSVEGEGRFLRWNSIPDLKQDNYLIGPRYTFRSWHKLRPYVKVLGGVSEMTYPYDEATGGYFTLGVGGGADYPLTHRISARADYEYQFYHDAPGFAGSSSNGLTPNGFSLGISYRIF